MKVVFSRRYGFSGLKFLIVFSIVTLVLVFLLVGILAQLRPVFEEKSSHAAKNKAIEIINSAASIVFSDIDNVNFVKITNDETGKITSVSVDTIQMNKLKSRLSEEIHTICENAETSHISIPIGSLTNIPVLQGMGYRIPVKISTDGIAKIDFDDDFLDAGINQVKHKIFMNVSVKMSVISASMSKSEIVETVIPVAETVISGTVPNYYGDNLSVVGR